MDTLPPIIHYVERNVFGYLLKYMLLSYEKSEFYMFLNIAVLTLPAVMFGYAIASGIQNTQVLSVILLNIMHRIVAVNRCCAC